MEPYFRSLQGISGTLVFERTNIGGAQLRVEDYAGFTGKRILVVTGTEDIDHPRAHDGQIVEWLAEAGASAEHLYLGDIGITGNGHMMMLETNSNEIAVVLMDWLENTLHPR